MGSLMAVTRWSFIGSSVYLRGMPLVERLDPVSGQVEYSLWRSQVTVLRAVCGEDWIVDWGPR